MLLRLILAFAIIVVLFLLIRRFRKSSPEAVTRFLKQIALFAVIGVLIFLIVTGRLPWLFALFASLIPLFRKALPLLRFVPFLSQLLLRFKATRAATGSASPSQTSQVETRYIRMSLDHNSGEIDGIVLEGKFKGQRLTQLPLEQLLQLLDECQANDDESARLLQAFLDKAHGESWRDQAAEAYTQSSQAPLNNTSMTDKEAYSILGLPEGASEQEVIDAHKKLILKMHPDRGGSSYLASKINQARDHLIKNHQHTR